MTVAQFNKLSKAKKKTLVAQDVIDQIEAKIYKPTRGRYCNIMLKPGDIKSDKKDVKSNFNQVKYCRVCGIGSAIMSITRFANKLTFNDVQKIGHYDDENSRDLINTVLSPKEQAYIEYCFEGNKNPYTRTHDKFGYLMSPSEIKSCKEFYKSHKGSSSVKLLALMQNIIDNKGKLVI